MEFKEVFRSKENLSRQIAIVQRRARATRDLNDQLSKGQPSRREEGAEARCQIWTSGVVNPFTVGFI